jgi:hypothetical protein
LALALEEQAQNAAPLTAAEYATRSVHAVYPATENAPIISTPLKASSPQTGNATRGETAAKDFPGPSRSLWGASPVTPNVRASDYDATEIPLNDAKFDVPTRSVAFGAGADAAVQAYAFGTGQDEPTTPKVYTFGADAEEGEPLDKDYAFGAGKVDTNRREFAKLEVNTSRKTQLGPPVMAPINKKQQGPLVPLKKFSPAAVTRKMLPTTTSSQDTVDVAPQAKGSANGSAVARFQSSVRQEKGPSLMTPEKIEVKLKKLQDAGNVTRSQRSTDKVNGAAPAF